VKVAELCGWKWFKYSAIDERQVRFGFHNVPDNSVGEFCGKYAAIKWDNCPDDWLTRGLPSVPKYPSDLNACAAFEKTLRGKERAWYIENLRHSLETPLKISKSRQAALAVN
jgi:hypothetical protein